MVQPARIIGSHTDKKGRQAQARLLSLAPYILFTKVETIGLPSVGSEVEMFRKDYDQSILRKPGDAVCLDISGIFINNANNKQIHIDIEDEIGVPFITYDSPVFAGAETYFNLRATFYLATESLLGRSVVLAPDAGALDVVAGFGVGGVYSTRKFSIVISGTGGSTDDIGIYSIRAEFSPGKGLDV